MVSLPHTSLAVGAIYRPPSLPLSYLLDWEDCFRDMYLKHSHVICLGDFNINMLDTSSPDAIYMQSALLTYNSLQIINEPTRITPNSQSLIDLIIVTNSLPIIKTGQLPPPGNSDHNVIFTITTFETRSPVNAQFITYRDYNHIDEITLLYLASNVNWSSIEVIDSGIDAKLNRLNQLIFNLMDSCFPLRKARVTKPRAPWLNDNIRCLMKERDRAHLACSRSNSSANWSHYKECRNKLNSAIKKAKACTFDKFINNNLGNSGRLFRNLKQLNVLADKSKSKALAPHLLSDVNALNSHFVLNSHQSNRKPPSTSKISGTPSSVNGASFHSFKEVNEADVILLIKSLSSHSTGMDGINLKCIHKLLPFIIRPLTHILNYSLMTGSVPSIWKEAVVVPLPKVNNPKSFKDFRPISILPTMSKILEKIVFRQLNKHIEDNNLLSEFQTGFRNAHSTTTTLWSLADDLCSNMDKGNISLLCLLDFSKAFDTVDHTLLVDRLRALGLSSTVLSWFIDYLHDRKQYVKHDVNGSVNLSDPLIISRGVPQGSILAPILFNIYVINLCSATKFSNRFQFADDTQIYISGDIDNLNTLLSNLNHDLDKIAEWSDTNMVSLNPSKTQCIAFGNKLALNHLNTETSQLFLQGCPIGFSDCAKNLGVHFDSSLSWNSHVDKICSAAYGKLRAIYRFSTVLSPAVKLRLTDCLILSHLDYCDVIYLGFNSDLSKRLQKIQNSCLRFSFNLRKFDHVSSVYNSQGLLNLHNRRILHFLSSFAKVVVNKAPHFLANKITECNSARLNILIPPRHNTAKFSKSFSVLGPRLWNRLPSSIKAQKHSPQAFKKSCKELLLSHQCSAGSNTLLNFPID